MKNTKKALLLSVMSLVLCVSMLVGTTFAWFTDSVSTGKNVIASGNLDVELEYYDLTAKEWKPVDSSTELFDDAALWEPGYTQVVHLRVSNKGSLALKYKLGVNIVSEQEGTLPNGNTFLLSKFIKFGTIEADKIYTDRAEARKDAQGVVDISAGYSDASVLYAEKDANGKTPSQEYVTLVVYMPETVGNEANHATGDSNKPAITLGVQLLATQLENEDDSFGTDYDKPADYAVFVDSPEALANALAHGGDIRLADDIDLEGPVELPEGVVVTLDLNGNTLNTATGYVVYNAAGSTLIIEDSTGEGEVRGAFYNPADATMIVENGTFGTSENGSYVFVNNGGALTINDATINGGSNYPVYSYGANNTLIIHDAVVNGTVGCINVYGINGKVTINGGTYTMTGREGNSYHIGYFANGDVTINGGTFKKLGDINMSGTGGGGICAIYGVDLTINGGSFAGDYADVYSWDGTNANGRQVIINQKGGTYAFKPGFVAEGHVATQNADGTWTVARDYTEVTAPTTDKVKNGEALADAINDTTEHTFLQLGEGEYKMPSVSGSKEVTIVGTEDTVIDVTLGAYLENSTVSFEGVTIKGSTGKANGNGSDYAALYTPNVTYTNCTFDGPFRIGRDGATFIGCTFNNLGNDYVWNYGNDCTFIGCTFNSEGKALLLYNDGGDEVAKVTVKDCVFNATQGRTAYQITNINCAAIEIDNHGNGVDLTVSGCKVNSVSDTLFSGLWRIKSHNGTDDDVFVNGVEYSTTALDGKTLTIVDRVATVED